MTGKMQEGAKFRLSEETRRSVEPDFSGYRQNVSKNTSTLTRRQFLALACLLPAAALTPLRNGVNVVAAGFVGTGDDGAGWPTGYRWMELENLGKVDRPGYVVVDPGGLDRERLDALRASLADLFPAGTHKVYLPVVLK